MIVALLITSSDNRSPASPPPSRKGREGEEKKQKKALDYSEKETSQSSTYKTNRTGAHEHLDTSTHRSTQVVLVSAHTPITLVLFGQKQKMSGSYERLAKALPSLK